jgi:hypothetical protein
MDQSLLLSIHVEMHIDTLVQYSFRFSWVLSADISVCKSPGSGSCPDVVACCTTSRSVVKLDGSMSVVGYQRYHL